MKLTDMIHKAKPAGGIRYGMGVCGCYWGWLSRFWGRVTCPKCLRGRIDKSRGAR